MILYKYLSPDRIDVLENACIRFTQPGSFNDLLESRPVTVTGLAHTPQIKEMFDDFIEGDGLRQTYDQDIPPILQAFLPFEAYKQLVVNHREELAEMLIRLGNTVTPHFMEAFIKERDKQLGVLSLSEDPLSTLMWSHYSKDHTGFVIGFDSENAFFDQRRSQRDDLRHLRKVAYVENKPNLPAIELDATSLFLTKSKDWEYEKEWRMIRPLVDGTLKHEDDKGFPIYLLQFPPEAIQQVILGNRISPAKQQLIMHLLDDARYAHVQVFSAIPHEAEWALKLIPYRPN